MSGFDLRLYVLMTIGGTSLIDVGANQNLQQRKNKEETLVGGHVGGEPGEHRGVNPSSV